MPSITPTSPPREGITVDETARDGFTIGDTSITPGFGDFGTDIADIDFFMSVMDTTYLLTTPESTTISPPRNDIASLLIPCRTAQPGPMSGTVSAVDSLGSPVASLTPSESLPSSEPGGGGGGGPAAQCPSGHGGPCLAQALDLLKHLSAALPPPSCPPAIGGLATPQHSPKAGSPQRSQDAWAQKLLAESKDIVEATRGMLACPCSGDNFLLNIIGMVVLKLLARYAAVARAQGGGGGQQCERLSGASRLARTFPSGAAAYGGARDEDGISRMRAQLVLGELHPIQRLINELSPRLKSASEDVRGNETLTTASLSAAILHQIGSDLHQSLSQLSASIIKRLRQS
ncbi:putative c6 transcription factor [Diaporthe ampelina]|uniref:Putative c6 transcription factor n=1 Tax=Diaporthe ampelina TaxID=1214573 RepID=A0A0G2FCN5_9PEZI|nr:putative c6 transcription factor [Diaporthe ampelina]